MESNFDLIILLHSVLDLLLNEPSVTVYHPLLALHLGDLPLLFLNDLIELDGFVAEPLNLVLQRGDLVVLQDSSRCILCYLLVLSDLFFMLGQFLLKGEDHGLIMLVVLQEIVIIQLINVPLKFVIMRLDGLADLLLG